MFVIRKTEIQRRKKICHVLTGENLNEEENSMGKFYPYHGMLSNNRAMTLRSKFKSDDFPNKQKNSRIEGVASGTTVPEPGSAQKGLLLARQP